MKNMYLKINEYQKLQNFLKSNICITDRNHKNYVIKKSEEKKFIDVRV